MRLRRQSKGDAQSTSNSPERVSTLKRLHSNESLSMKTRVASKTASLAAESIKSSQRSNDSRRSSLAELTFKTTNFDSDNERPTKIARLSPRSCSTRNSSSNPSSQQTDSIAPKAEDQEDQEDQLINGDSITETRHLQSEESSLSKEDAIVQDGLEDVAKDSIEVHAPARASARRGRGRGRHHVIPRGKHLKASASITPAYGTPALDRTESAQIDSPEKREAGRLAKRLPGRRRAPNPDSHIEADLRRQLDLKITYRAVVKALKPILGELAKRTANELREDAELHTKCPEYKCITDALDVRLKERLAIIDHQFKHEKARLERALQAGEEEAKIRFKENIGDIKTNHVLFCQQTLMSTVRQSEQDDDSEATDDDSDVVPRLSDLKGPMGKKILLEEWRASRSRFYVETEHRWKLFEKRFGFRQTQQTFDPSSLASRPKGFVTFDLEPRRNAVAILNVHQLADAAEDVEDLALKIKQRDISNEAATGLQALASATERAPRLPPASSTKPKATRKPATTPVSLSFAPVYTPASGSGGANYYNTAVTPSPQKRRTRNRVPTARGNTYEFAATTPNSLNRELAAPRQQLQPITPGKDVSTGYVTRDGQDSAAFKYSRSETASSFSSAQRQVTNHTRADSNASARVASPGLRVETSIAASRPDLPNAVSMQAFSGQSRDTPQAILPPYPGPYPPQQMPPPFLRHTIYQASPSARNQSNWASPSSPYNAGWPMPQTNISNHYPQSADGSQRHSSTDLRSYREISRRPSITTPTQEPNRLSDAERRASQTSQAPEQPPARHHSTEDISRDGHPLPPPPPQLYPHSQYGRPDYVPYLQPSGPYGQYPQFRPIGISPPPPPAGLGQYYYGNFSPSYPPPPPQYQQSQNFPGFSPPPIQSPAATRHNSIPLQQHPGQVGHQTILPATLDPKRQQSAIGSSQFPVFSQLSAIPRAPYGRAESGSDKSRGTRLQSSPVQFHFEPYKGPPKR